MSTTRNKFNLFSKYFYLNEIICTYAFLKIFGIFKKYLLKNIFIHLKNIYRPGVWHAGGHPQWAADLRERHAAVQVDHPLHVQPRPRASGQVGAHVRRGPEVERASTSV